jgi:hypothetical protein
VALTLASGQLRVGFKLERMSKTVQKLQETAKSHAEHPQD